MFLTPFDLPNVLFSCATRNIFFVIFSFDSHMKEKWQIKVSKYWYKIKHQNPNLTTPNILFSSMNNI